MRILVIGGTGFLGKYLIPKLKKHAVRAVVRKETDQKKIAWLKKQGVEPVLGDILDELSLLHAAQDVDVIINLVGIIKEEDHTFEEIHHGGTLHALSAAQDSHVKQFVYVSALGAEADADNPYHQSKYLAEEAVKSSGIPYTIFRPSVYVGPEDGFMNFLAGIMKKSYVIPVFGDGKYELQPIYVDDVAEYIARSIGNREALNQTFEIGGPKRYSYNNLLYMIAALLKKDKSLFHIPLFLAKPGVAVIEFLLSDPPITMTQLNMLVKGNVVSNQKARKVFTFPLEDIEKVMKRYVHQ